MLRPVRPISSMFVPTIATQNGYVATLHDRNICATLPDKKTLCNFAQLKNNMLQFWATEVFARLGLQFGLMFAIYALTNSTKK